MVAPLDDAAPCDREGCKRFGFVHPFGSRSHEMMHVTWTPANARDVARDAGVSDLAILAAEDMRNDIRRVDFAGMQPPVPGSCIIDSAKRLHGMIESEDFRNALIISCLMLAGHPAEVVATETVLDGAGDYGEFVRHVYAACDAIFAGNVFDVDARDFESAVHVARILDSALVASDSFREPESEPEPEGTESTPGRGNAGEGENAGWATLTVETPPLDNRHHARAVKRRVHREFGSVPTAIHRLTTDGRIFGRDVRRPGGTLLIDRSGSMEWNDRDLEAILNETPSATVAVYAGKEATGVLRIVARNGRRVRDSRLLRFPFENNAVDGPALSWLASQSEPRVWYSDGEVTGNGLRTQGTLARDANRRARAGNIVRVETPDDARDAIAGRRVAHVPVIPPYMLMR